MKSFGISSESVTRSHGKKAKRRLIVSKDNTISPKICRDVTNAFGLLEYSTSTWNDWKNKNHRRLFGSYYLNIIANLAIVLFFVVNGWFGSAI